jgi:AcrR family transcriptional regulator
MNEQRRHRIRLEISREASRLFWEQGVDATSGEQIAAAVGLSVRTIWRHFRNKESCAEPIVTQGMDWEMATLRSWPRHLSLEAHFAAEVRRYGREAGPVERADNMLAMKMILLADKEPAIVLPG